MINRRKWKILIISMIILINFVYVTCVNAEENKNVNIVEDSINDSFYNIFSLVGNDQVIEIAGGAISDEVNVQTYQKNNTNAQSFKFIKDKDGSYEIINKNSGKALDVKSGKANNGTNVWQYARNGTNAQKWILEKTEDGYYYIISKININYCLDVSAGNNKNGTNIQIYSKNGSCAQKFKLEENSIMKSEKSLESGLYKIVSNADDTKVLDVSSGSTAKNANIQIYTDNMTDAQKFYIQYETDGYYTIINKKSKKSMSAEENNIGSGGNIFQGDQVLSDAQKWILRKNSDNTYTIFSKQSEMCLDIKDGVTNNGNNVREYKSDLTKAQKWILIPVENIESTKTIDNGEYNIKTALNTEKVIGIQSETKNSGAYAQIENENNAISQRFNIEYEKDGYYTITNRNSGKVLDVESANKQAGTYVWQYEKNNSNAQKWIIKDVGNGYYNIISKLNGLYLTVERSNTSNGTKFIMSNNNSGKNQKFKLTKYEYIEPEIDSIEDGIYQIVLKNNKVLDISGGTYNDGGKLQIWGNDEVQQQKFLIKQIGHSGYYQIINVNSGKVLDVESGYQQIHTNIIQYHKNGTNAQKWIIKKTENGYYKIISACNNLVLDVAGGLNNCKNGTKMQVYFDNGTNAQRFKFQKIAIIKQDTYEIETMLNSNKVLDIAYGSVNDGANVQLYDADNVDQQKFSLEYNNGEYIIKLKHSGKVLTVDTNSNVYQSTYSNLENQKWYIEPAGNGYYNIISKYNGLYIGIDNGNTSNGTNVKVFSSNPSASAQKFKFVKGFRTFFQEGIYGNSGLRVAGDGRGTGLKYYKFGKGNNVLFATFSIHGFEDSYGYDGKELTYIGEQFKNRLHNCIDKNIINNWTIYIFPTLNPDGQNYGWTNNGPGRNTLYSQAPGNKGIDMNRGWQTEGNYTRYYDDRNYNGTAPYQAYEVRALREFLLNHKSSSGQNLLIDLHGWLNETIGDEGLGRYYRSQYGMSKHIYSYGKGYLVNWARQSLGNWNRTARSVLVELPQVYNHQELINRDFAGKYINATLSMLREN